MNRSGRRFHHAVMNTILDQRRVQIFVDAFVEVRIDRLCLVFNTGRYHSDFVRHHLALGQRSCDRIGAAFIVFIHDVATERHHAFVTILLDRDILDQMEVCFLFGKEVRIRFGDEVTQ